MYQILKALLKLKLAEGMGVGSRGQGAVTLLDFHKWYRYTVVNRRLIVLFFGIFCYFRSFFCLLLLEIFLPTPLDEGKVIIFAPSGHTTAHRWGFISYLFIKKSMNIFQSVLRNHFFFSFFKIKSDKSQEYNKKDW